MAGSASSLCTGTVTHVRREPAENVFTYRACWYLLDLDELPELERRLWPIFGIDRRFRPLSLRTHDHLRAETGATLRDRLDACLRRHGIEPPGGRVLLQTSLRVLGYVFNPVSLWFCHDPSDRLETIVMEVNNTYGETHPYVLQAAEQSGTEPQDDQVPPRPVSAGSADAATTLAPPRAQTWTATRTKRFHVSPFLGLGMRYDIQVDIPSLTPTSNGERVRFVVRVTPPGGGAPFVAVQQGTRRALTVGSVLRAQLRHPLMPQRTTALIHWQALKLALKRVPFFSKPEWIPGTGSVARVPASSPTTRPDVLPAAAAPPATPLASASPRVPTKEVS